MNKDYNDDYSGYLDHTGNPAGGMSFDDAVITEEDAVRVFPEDVASPYLYASELNGPSSVSLKEAVMKRQQAAPRLRRDAREHRNGFAGGVILALVFALMAWFFAYAEQRFGYLEGRDWFTLILIVYFLLFIAVLSYLLADKAGMKLFGIGAAIAISIAYLKFMKHRAVVMGMLALCLVLCLAFLIRYIVQRGRTKKEQRELEQTVAEAESGMFSAFDRRMQAFRDDLIDALPDRKELWCAAYRHLAGEMTDARKHLTGWTVIRSGWKSDLIPVWKGGGMSGKMREAPEESWWTDLKDEDAARYSVLYKKFLDTSKTYTEQEKTEYFRTVKLCAEHGYSGAAGELGYLYSNGFGIGKDKVLSMLWNEVGTRDLMRAPDRTSPYAAYGLAVQFWNGNSLVPKDEAIARELMQLAVSHGSENAEEWMKEHGQ